MSERTWGDIEKEIRDDYLRADGPENINFREVQWDVWYAEVVREAEARAIEEAADALTLAPYTAINHGSPHRWPYQWWLRARAAEIREGK